MHATEHLPQHPRRIYEKHHPDKNARLLARQPQQRYNRQYSCIYFALSNLPPRYTTINVNSNFLDNGLNVSLKNTTLHVIHLISRLGRISARATDMTVRQRYG